MSAAQKKNVKNNRKLAALPDSNFYFLSSAQKESNIYNPSVSDWRTYVLKNAELYATQENELKDFQWNDAAQASLAFRSLFSLVD